MAFLGLVPAWAWKALALLLLLAGIWFHGYTHGRNGVQRELDTFKAQVAEKGAAQAIAARQQETRDRAIKEKVDETATRKLAVLSADNKRLRDERSRSGILPSAPAGSVRPERAAFQRADLERALEQLDAGVSAIVDEGDVARLKLDTARGWAQSPR